MVSLPSIRDIFPQYMSQKLNSSSIHHHNSMAPQCDSLRYDHCVNGSSPIACKPLFITKPIQPLWAYPSTPSLPQRPHSRTSLIGSPVIGQPPPLNNMGMHVKHPSGGPYSVRIGGSPESFTPATSAAPSYSFGVFKSTADGSSLDHIATTTTLRRGRSTAGRQSDSAAANITALSPIKHHTKQSSSTSDEQDDLSPDAMNAGPYSSFMLSDLPPSPNRFHQRTIVIGDQVSGTKDDPSKNGEKGKVHECPHCSKRFNRPSSLQIHANTHTGARPFRCPHPNCGREFNVNSNMRRHYRNHARSNSSRGHAATSKAVRRKMEQISTTMVGVGAIAGHEYTGVMSFSHAQTHSADESAADEGDDRMRSEYSDSEWERDLDDTEDVTNAGAHMRNQQGGDDPESDQSGLGLSHRRQGRQEHGLDHAGSPTVSPKLCNPRHPQHTKEQNTSQATTYPHSYTPSTAAYLQSCTDLNVSTVLRPAFSSRIPKEALIVA